MEEKGITHLCSCRIERNNKYSIIGLKYYFKLSSFFHEIPKDEEIGLYSDENIEVKNILLDHTIDCSGFIFKEKKYKRKIIKRKIR